MWSVWSCATVKANDGRAERFCGDPMRALALGLLLAMLRANALAQGSNTIRSETKVVLVDAVVTDKKGYVHGLTAKDFDIFEDDKKQTITSFSGEADPVASTKAQSHYTVLLFDDSSMDNAEKRRAREAAVRFCRINWGSRTNDCDPQFSGIAPGGPELY